MVQERKGALPGSGRSTQSIRDHHSSKTGLFSDTGKEPDLGVCPSGPLGFDFAQHRQTLRSSVDGTRVLFPGVGLFPGGRGVSRSTLFPGDRGVCRSTRPSQGTLFFFFFIIPQPRVAPCLVRVSGVQDSCPAISAP